MIGARAASAVVLVVMVVAAARPVCAQPGTWPTAVEQLDLQALAGDWYEAASYGSWSHRRCLADTRFAWTVRDVRTLDVRSACTTATGEETRSGRLRAPESHVGRLAVRFAPAILTWLPAAWSDHWVIAVDTESNWVLVGDRRRERLSLLSRWASPDEASMARAIGIARAQGFDVDRLAKVLQSRLAPARTR